MDKFYLDQNSDGNFMIRPPDFAYELCKGSSGSYNIFAARLCGLSYSDFLRLCRDRYKAILKGKQGYSYAMWTETLKSNTKELLTDLNVRLKVWQTKAKADKLI